MPSRAILCLHSDGSSATIFRFQLSSFCAAMKNDFDFVYVTAPHTSDAGPGVLPFFADAKPFFTWFQDEEGLIEEKAALFSVPIRETVYRWTKHNPRSKIVGVLGFSQGALAATVLLWQQQMGFLPWLPKLDFGVLICSGFNYEAMQYMRETTEKTLGDGESGMRVRIPTVHLHGRQDWALEYSKKMLLTQYSTELVTTIQFEGQHECPRDLGAIKEAAARITTLAGIGSGD